MKKLFTIGSVVKLKNIEKRVMIVGHLQREKEGNKAWDYAGVIFPIGVIDPDKMLLFNHETIERLYFIGLQDDESIDYMRSVFEYINSDDNMENKESPLTDG